MIFRGTTPGLASCLLLFASGPIQPFVKGQTPVVLPLLTGPYQVIGVHDFEFLDQTYPSDRGDEAVNGRRIMARVWYPSAAAADTLGLPRPLFTDQERQAVMDPFIQAFAAAIDMNAIFDSFTGTVSQSHWDLAPLESSSEFPIVVYSTGALGNVGTNQALAEDLASHGYIVFSVTHPGGTWILYPNGDTDSVDQDFLGAVFAPAPEDLTNPDINVRYQAVRDYLESSSGTIPYLPRWRDDMIALVDYLERIITPDQPVTENRNGNTLLHDVLGGARDVPLQVVCGGMSFGGSASGSAAQMDERILGAFNLDDFHKSLDLLDVAVRVPYLNILAGGPIYPNEFFFEPLQKMGTDPNVYRIAVADTVHLEYIDVMFVPAEKRMMIGGGRMDSAAFHRLLAESILAFLAMAFGTDNMILTPESMVAAYPEKASVLDVGYVREWALETFPQESTTSTTSEDPVDVDDETSAVTVLTGKVVANFCCILVALAIA